MAGYSVAVPGVRVHDAHVVLEHHHPLAGGNRAGGGVGGHDGDPLDALHPPQRAQDVREHRLDERAPPTAGERLGQALLRDFEALDRDDGERSHGRPFGDSNG